MGAAGDCERAAPHSPCHNAAYAGGWADSALLRPSNACLACLACLGAMVEGPYRHMHVGHKRGGLGVKG